MEGGREGEETLRAEEEMETGKEHQSGGSEGGNIRVEEVMETGMDH